MEKRRWMKWLTAVLALNVALGLGFSVVLLRHDADSRKRVDVALARLDGTVAEQTGSLWRAATAGGPVPSDVTPRVLDGLARELRSQGDASVAPVLGALGTYERELGAVDAARGPRLDAARRLQPAADRLRAAIAHAASAHAARGRSAGRIADFETVFLMVFAALMAALLVRKLDATRRAADARAAAERARSEARLRALVHHSSDVISVVDADGTISFQTRSLERVLGHSADELAGTSLFDLIHPDDRAEVEAVQREVAAGPGHSATVTARWRHADGSWRYMESIRTNLLAEPDIAAIVVNSRDVSERKQLEDQLTHTAFHDALTNLPNRALFADRLTHALAANARRSAPLAVLFLDLDDFKAVNDTFGHGAGDELLRAVADRLRGCLRPGDTVARLGGDEFAVLLDRAIDEDQAVRLAERILAALQAPFSVDGNGVTLQTSVGIALGAASVSDSDELMRNADVAMYAAKAKGKGRYEVFAPAMNAAVIGRLQLKSELERALSRDELTVHYQPTVRLADGSIIGMEALVRWHHPERGLVPPGDFIPLAEETGLIVPVGRFVLRKACHQARDWQVRYPSDPPLVMSVNLSARELEDARLVEEVAAALRDSGLPPECLTLEVTETLLMLDVGAAAAKLRELGELGVRLAIDDFGTGYSSLGYLEQLPVDVIKIDKSFVDRLCNGRDESVMVQAITRLGHALRLQLVAEGIERAEQVSELRSLECQLGQGFYFAKPLAGEGVEALLEALGDRRLPMTAAPETAGTSETLRTRAA